MFICFFSLLDIKKSCSRLEKVIFLIMNSCFGSVRYFNFHVFAYQVRCQISEFSPAVFIVGRNCCLCFLHFLVSFLFSLLFSLCLFPAV